MTSAATAPAALDGSRIDGGLYTTVTDFARHTHWLNQPMVWWTSYGAVLFVLLLIAAWWRARRADAAAMAGALSAFAAAAIAFLLNSGIKDLVAEPRPCRALPHDFLLEACPVPSDYAFPSNHTTVAFAAAVALLLIDRRLGAFAIVAAVLMGASRVYVGAHYPHDVLASALVGALVAIPTVLTGRRALTPAVELLRTGALRPLLSAG
ncbi:phosphatase PAP2 family protein [Kitasatospora sp. NBC_01287]|uniref:phosphatase PAP2 family protein n=1 Tax=Kitasatospora sp. NBC_01287 TaxID=2903573 RepID=UPI00224F1534|nr:phosphatase PAP2 family protein [Kitasatospora sp. NBC_01287]MCX4749228.1 phosphatase PAP2 family protein [Kitasatospora sp. NBC_01287]